MVKTGMWQVRMHAMWGEECNVIVGKMPLPWTLSVQTLETYRHRPKTAAEIEGSATSG